MPNAPDCESSSEWRFSVAAASAAVTGWPLLKVTPLRILNAHVLASAEASQLSASQGCAVPSLGSVTTRHSPQPKITFCGTVLAARPGSRLSVVWPPL